MGSIRGSRIAEQMAHLQMKKKITDEVRVRFARFGEEIMSLILSYALVPKRMPVLLQQIGARPTGNINAQLDSILSFLSAVGPMEFCKRLNVDLRIPAGPEGYFAPTEGSPGAARERGMIQAPGYQGPDRRSGLERRKGNDRRGDASAVRKNLRFGGDRRKLKPGRRKQDRHR